MAAIFKAGGATRGSDGERRETPATWMILIAGFLDMMAMGIVMPVLPA